MLRPRLDRRSARGESTTANAEARSTDDQHAPHKLTARRSPPPGRCPQLASTSGGCARCRSVSLRLSDRLGWPGTFDRLLIKEELRDGQNVLAFNVTADGEVIASGGALLGCRRPHHAAVATGLPPHNAHSRRANFEERHGI